MALRLSLLLSGILEIFLIVLSSECFLNKCLEKWPTSSKQYGQRSFSAEYVDSGHLSFYKRLSS